MNTLSKREQIAAMEDPCMPYEGAISNTGYGVKWHNGKSIGAHRWAWEQVNGPVPAGAMVLHRCDVKSCINVRHLYIGSRKDNARDAIDRGQMPRGDRHGTKTRPERIRRGHDKPNAKLTRDQVAEIRSLYKPKRWTLKELSEKYGVSPSVISRVIRGETYNEPDALLAELGKDRAQGASNPWEEIANQAQRNAEFYHGIVVQIGELFGEAARTSDDGSVQNDVLALKVPELVKAMLDQQANGRTQPDPEGWIPHTPGDPMPCEASAKVSVRLAGGHFDTGKAGEFLWGKTGYENGEITHWIPE